MKNRKLYNPLFEVYYVYVKTTSYNNIKSLLSSFIHFCFQVKNWTPQKNKMNQIGFVISSAHFDKCYNKP
jgi:hypothetical protein